MTKVSETVFLFCFLQVSLLVCLTQSACLVVIGTLVFRDRLLSISLYHFGYLYLLQLSGLLHLCRIQKEEYLFSMLSVLSAEKCMAVRQVIFQSKLHLAAYFQSFSPAQSFQCQVQ